MEPAKCGPWKTLLRAMLHQMRNVMHQQDGVDDTTVHIMHLGRNAVYCMRGYILERLGIAVLHHLSPLLWCLDGSESFPRTQVLHMTRTSLDSDLEWSILCEWSILAHGFPAFLKATRYQRGV